MRLNRFGIVAFLAVLFIPALVLAQATTSSTSTAAIGDVVEAGKAVYSAFQVSVLAGINAILVALTVLARVPQVRKIAKLRKDDPADFVPPLLFMLSAGYTAAMGALATGLEWYMAVPTGIVAALGSGFFANFMKEVRD